MSRNYLPMNDELQPGDFLLSSNGEYKAVFQEDGNFVVFGSRLVWESKTAGNTNARRLIMQEDCNLVMYTANSVLWHTNTHSPHTKTCRLTLGNDGVLVVQHNGNEVWSSRKWN